MKRARKHDWPAIARALAARIPKTALHPAVTAWAAKAARASGARQGWAVAFSGGADSLAALLLIWAHWPERRGRLLALHFDHRLRGRASTADARFCAQVARSLDVPCAVGRWTRRAGDSRSEAAAREARMEFFAAELNKAGAGALWLGHQLDDVAETVLMRLARGSGAEGLAAPRPVQAFGPRRVHLRPLLTLKKAQLVAHLDAVGASGAWREDATNATPAHVRNRLRHEVLPAWETASGRDVLSGTALSRELLEEDAVALNDWLGRLAAFPRKGCLSLAALAELPRAVVRRALHRWLLDHKGRVGDLSRQGFMILLEALERGAPTRFSLGSSGFAVIKAGFLTFERKSLRRSTPPRSSS